jgi:hypothetical protein
MGCFGNPESLVLIWENSPMDLRITTYRRAVGGDCWQEACVRAETARALAWLREYTVLPVFDDDPCITVSADGVQEYISDARRAGLEVVET